MPKKVFNLIVWCYHQPSKSKPNMDINVCTHKLYSISHLQQHVAQLWGWQTGLKHAKRDTTWNPCLVLIWRGVVASNNLMLFFPGHHSTMQTTTLQSEPSTNSRCTLWERCCQTATATGRDITRKLGICYQPRPEWTWVSPNPFTVMSSATVWKPYSLLRAQRSGES